jgi:hypothetical protein
VGIKLNIEITSPMDARDHELLSGIAVMTLAIANHELAEQRFPEAFEDPGEKATQEALDSLVKDGLLEEVKEPDATPPKLCGVLADPPDGDMICVSEVGSNGLHKGRHKFRPIQSVEAQLAPLAN